MSFQITQDCDELEADDPKPMFEGMDAAKAAAMFFEQLMPASNNSRTPKQRKQYIKNLNTIKRYEALCSSTTTRSIRSSN